MDIETPNADRKLNEYLNYVDYLKNLPPDYQSEAGRPVVTISRQLGAGGMEFADLLAATLSAKRKHGDVPWLAFDRNLADEVIREHNLPQNLAPLIAEKKRNAAEGWWANMLKLESAEWNIIKDITETVRRLALLGNCVLVGRGSTVITQDMPNVLHIRLAASEKTRAERVAKRQGITEREALEVVREAEKQSQRYFLAYFNRDVDDISLYHMIIGTDHFTIDEAVDLVASLVHHHFPVPEKNR